MGSNSSKSGNAVSQSSSSSSRVRKTRSRGNSVFQSSCLRSTDIDDSDDQQSKEFGGYGPRSNGADQESNLVKTEGYSKVEQTEEIPGVTSDAELDERGQDSIINTISRTNSSSSGGFLSRSGFFSGNVSCRLSRTTSDGSSRRAHPLSSTNFSVSSNEELYQNKGAINGNLCVNSQASASSNNFRDVTTIPTQGMVRENSNAGVRYDASSHSPRNHTAFEGTETRLAARPIGAREPAERNVRFSRTLSVGRLRDRVLHRTSLPILSSYPLQQEREDGVGRHSGGRQAWNVETGESVFNGNTLSTSTSSSYAPSSMSSSLYNGRDYETTRSREERYHDLLEHRSHFVERRRRIRSQLRALQRLGGRFGNLSGHERSCVLYRQTGGVGRCSCRTSAQGANPNDDASARSSISRIVVLAEALFEVLDEIHQQSVVLSSRASVSAIGSVPAPIEVVESLPLKSYTKVPKHLTEDAAQCYICLVEYEEGDSMRMLPCHHEFHRVCIDKWLKEIHRVCPLCRGDICRSDSYSMGK